MKGKVPCEMQPKVENLGSSYDVVSKISRTDAEKIITHHTAYITFEVVPCRMQTPVPQSPPFLERFLLSPFLSVCQALSEIRLGSHQCIKPASFQLQFHF
jgi:hypothetical protein